MDIALGGRTRTALLILGTVLLLQSEIANSSAIFRPFRFDAVERSRDQVPPRIGEVVVARIRRGCPGEILGNGMRVHRPSQGDGIISLSIRGVHDNYTMPNDMGFRVEIVANRTPTMDFKPFEGVLRGWSEFRRTELRWCRLNLRFTDGAVDDQEAMDFDLVIYPVDRGGNEGRPSAPLRIVHPGGRSQ